MNKTGHHQPHPASHYVTIWFGILVLFAISIAMAQFSSYRPLILVVAFAIAIIQALLVGAYFMHLKLEERYIHYLLYAMLSALALFYLGIVSDTGRPAGLHWTATDSSKIIEEHKAAPHTGEHAAH